MTREERQKAINALKKSAPIMAMTQQEFSDYIQTINQVMDWLEQEPRWIPISEGLPKDIKPVQITWKNNEPATYYQDIKGKHFTGVAHYKDGKWYWYSDVTLDFLMEYGRCEIYEFDSAIEVVAWMPMPKPYETESEVDNGNDDGY